jgi:hypothetical protein
VFKHDGEGREQNNGPQRVVVSGRGGEAEMQRNSQMAGHAIYDASHVARHRQLTCERFF